VRKIADMAHAKGVDVLVDRARLRALRLQISDLGVDYYAASLHKWLGCPLGTGISTSGARRSALWRSTALAHDRRCRHARS
jgi:selenocysteine lyase/cysteine desulfurase